MPQEALSAIDVDRHVDPPTMHVLSEYLPAHYADQVLISGWSLDRYYRHWYPSITRSTAAAPAAVEMPDRSLRRFSYLVLTCLSGVEGVRDPYLAAALAKGLNSWFDETWLSAEKGIYGSLCVPFTNVDAAVEQIDALGAGPFAQVLFPVRSDAPYGNIRYHRVLEACARNDLVVALHAWGAGLNPSTPSGAPDSYVEDYLANGQIAEAQVASLICEGVFELYPNLRVSLLECGFAWIPGFLWRLDKDWKGLRREVPWVKRLPSEYFYAHVRVSTMPAHAPHTPDGVTRLMDMVRGGEVLMYATDHPHRHGDHTDLQLKGLSMETADAIVWRNALAQYRLSP